MNRNENKEQSFAQIYNSSQAISNREAVRKEINSTPLEINPKRFEKTPQERGMLYTLRHKWREMIKKQGLSKRKVPMQTYLKVS